LKQEYETLVKMGFNENNLREFAENSIKSSFADEKTKQYLLSLI